MRITDPIYIAGPMSSLPDPNYPEFNRVAGILRSLNFRVENPADNAKYAPEGAAYEWYIRAGLLQLLRCKNMVLLPGWRDSYGAKLEHAVATALGFEIFEWEEVESWAAVTPFRLAPEKS